MLLAVGGCATSGAVGTPSVGARPYRPYRLPVAASPSAVLAAAKDLALEMGAKQILVRNARLTAIVPVDEGVRDEIVVEVANGELSLAYQTEMAIDGAWIAGDGVCATYAYTRESKLAHEIVASAPAAVAAR